MLRKFTFLAFICLLTILAAGCKEQTNVDNGKIRVVTSFYPLYDFAVKIGGPHVAVANLVPAGVEPHDWSPKSKDLTQLNQANLFVYQGVGIEGWVEDFLGGMKKDSKVTVVEASKGANLIKHEEEEEHDKKKDDHGHEEEEYDPHIWLSPVQSKKLAENIKNGLIQADPAHQSDYEANYTKLASQFDQLHQTYKDALVKVPKKELVVSHEAFGYLCREYGLTQMPIMGLSPDSEPRPQDMKEISDFIKNHNVKTIFFEELVSDKLAKTLANDLKIQTLVLNPLEGLTEAQVKNGDDYFTVMNSNLQNMLKGLQ